MSRKFSFLQKRALELSVIAVAGVRHIGDWLVFAAVFAGLVGLIVWWASQMVGGA